MKFNLDHTEVTMTAKNTLLEDHNETKGLLLELSIVYGLASEMMEIRGLQALAKDYKGKANDLYNKLDKMGVFKDIE